MILPPDSLDPLADLRAPYLERLRARVASLSAFIHDAERGNLQEASMSEGHRCVHSLISSAAIFGHLKLSRAARTAEQAFERHHTLGTEYLIIQIATLVETANEVLDIDETPTR